MRCMFASLVFLAISHVSTAISQDKAGDVAALQQQNELLAAKLEAANLKIEKLERQLAELKAEKKTDSVVGAEDQFAVGATWTGTRNYTQNGPSNDFQDWKLVVTERNGKSFKGEIHFRSIDNKNQVLAVSGTVPGGESGRVIFQTDQKGVFQQKFSGNLKGGQISIQFEGTGVKGGRVTGTGNLKQ